MLLVCLLINSRIIRTRFIKIPLEFKFSCPLVRTSEMELGSVVSKSQEVH